MGEFARGRERQRDDPALGRRISGLSDLSIERMKAPEAGRVQVYDALVPGLVLRVSSTARTWSFMFRVGGVQKRLSLGEWPGMGVALAR